MLRTGGTPDVIWNIVMESHLKVCCWLKYIGVTDVVSTFRPLAFLKRGMFLTHAMASLMDIFQVVFDEGLVISNQKLVQWRSMVLHCIDEWLKSISVEDCEVEVTIHEPRTDFVAWLLTNKHAV